MSHDRAAKIAAKLEWWKHAHNAPDQAIEFIRSCRGWDHLAYAEWFVDYLMTNDGAPIAEGEAPDSSWVHYDGEEVDLYSMFGFTAGSAPDGMKFLPFTVMFNKSTPWSVSKMFPDVFGTFFYYDANDVPRFSVEDHGQLLPALLGSGGGNIAVNTAAQVGESLEPVRWYPELLPVLTRWFSSEMVHLSLRGYDLPIEVVDTADRDGEMSLEEFEAALNSPTGAKMREYLNR